MSPRPSPFGPVLVASCLAAAVTLPASEAAAAADVQLFWVDTAAKVVRTGDPDGASAQNVVGTPAVAGRLILDPAAGHLYFSGIGGASYEVRRADLDGDGAGLVAQTGAGNIAPFAVDPKAQRVFFADFDALRRMGFGDSGSEIIAPGFPDAWSTQTYGLDWHAASGRLFWLAAEYLGGPPGRCRLTSMLPDGSDPQVLFEEVGACTGEGLVATDDGVYFVAEGHIQRVDHDGAGPEVLVADAAAKSLDVDLEGPHLYWLTSDSVRRAGLDGSSPETLFALSAAASLRVYRQPPPCELATHEDGTATLTCGATSFTLESGANALVAATAVEAGEPCAFGGHRVQVGADDGSGGAIAKDGVLQAGEVDQTFYACDGAPGADGAAGVSALVEVSALEAGDPLCPAGGQWVAFGLDADGDGALQAGEVAGGEAVCHGEDGAPGAAALVVSSPVDDPEVCPAGGWSIAVGHDADGDGTLGEGEVTHEAVVCHGAPGEDGKSALLVVTALPAGDAACPNGGQRVEGGVDADGDGQLAAAEVTQSAVVCHGAEGADGVPAAVATTALAAGEGGCAQGGWRVDVGLDLDGDGALDADEITASAALCHGADGQDGAAGDPGPGGGACTVVDHGDGSASMTCPDGTSVRFLTEAPAADGGCRGGAAPVAPGLAVLGLALWAWRRRAAAAADPG